MTSDIVIFTEFTSTTVFQRLLGAYRIATELRKNGYTVQVVDYFTEWNLDELKLIVDKFVGPNTLFVGFSSTLYAIRDEALSDSSRPNHYRRELRYTEDFPFKPEVSHAFISHIKEVNPNTKIVLGGQRSQYKNSKLVDCFIHGYADHTTVEYAHFLAGKPYDASVLKMVPINDKQIEVDWIKDPEWNFQTSQVLWQPNDLIYENEVLPIEISRGCIFRCDFCSFPMNGKTKLDYIKDPGPLREEFIRNYEQWGITNYIFADDTYNDSIYKVEKLYNEVFSKLPFKIQFSAYLRHDLIYQNRDMAPLLKESGLKTCVFGLETMNHDSAKAIGKGLHPEKGKELLHWLRDDEWGKDITMSSGFIVGLPHETEETFREWMKWVEDPNCPLDGYTVEPLGFNINEKKIWPSKFEADPESYGYTIVNKGVANNSFFKWSLWTNKHMSLPKAWALADEYIMRGYRSGRIRPAGFFQFMWMNGTGLTADDLAGMSVKNVSATFLKDKKAEWFDQYKTRLFNL